MVVKQERELMLGTGAKAPASGAAAGLPDGRYLAGFRVNHLHLRAPGGERQHPPAKGFRRSAEGFQWEPTLGRSETDPRHEKGAG